MAEYPYVYQPYPKTLYHATLPAVVVQNAEEQQAMGAEWCETATAAQAVLESAGVPIGGIVPDEDPPKDDDPPGTTYVHNYTPKPKSGKK